MAKSAATVYDSSGKQLKGAYVENGKTYKSDGSRIDSGSVVKLADGRTFRMDDDDDAANNVISRDQYDSVANAMNSITYAGAPTISGGQSIPVTAPGLRGGKVLASDYGIIQNRQELEKLMMDYVDKTYAQKEVGMKQAENAFQETIAVNAEGVSDVLRKNALNAIRTGASTGVSAAQDLSAILGLSQASAEGATLMGQQRGKLADERAMAESQARLDSLNTSNELGKILGELDMAYYNADTVRYGAELGYNGGLEQAYGGIAAQKIAADAQLRAAEIGRQGQLGAASISAAAAAKYGQATPTTAGPFEAMYNSWPKDVQQAYMIASTSGQAKDWETFQTLLNKKPPASGTETFNIPKGGGGGKIIGNWYDKLKLSDE